MLHTCPFAPHNIKFLRMRITITQCFPAHSVYPQLIKTWQRKNNTLNTLSLRAESSAMGYKYRAAQNKATLTRLSIEFASRKYFV